MRSTSGASSSKNKSDTLASQQTGQPREIRMNIPLMLQNGLERIGLFERTLKRIQKKKQKRRKERGQEGLIFVTYGSSRMFFGEYPCRALDVMMG